MRFVPKLNVRNRLTFTFLLVILLSWWLNMLAFRYVMEREFQRERRELAAQGIVLPERGNRRPEHDHLPGMGMPPGAAGPTAAGPTVAGPRHGEARQPGTTARPGDIHTGQAHPGPAGPGAIGGTGSAPTPDASQRPAPMSRRAARRARVWNRVVSIQMAVAVLLSLAAGAWLSRRFTRPLALLEEGAHAFHERRYQHRIPRQGDDEFSRVAATMNEMAERVEAQIAALETDARRRQHLLADVAHELRSPVATLKTMAEALRDGVANQPERRERALCAMVGTADRMQRLVTDLMELAKLDLRELPLHVRSVDLADVAEESLALRAEAAERAGVVLHPLEADGPMPVQGDALRLAQVIDNLLGNAVDHAGSGAEVCVRISGGTGTPVTLTVEDTGRGIPADKLPFVFDPFYRGDGARTPGGPHSGLGLRIARGLAEAHGGTLTLESEEGRGTRAILTLPALEAIPSGQKPPEPAKRQPEPAL